MLKVTDLQLFLGRRKVLEGASLSAKAGEVCCIVGPNGSGKTTILRAVTGELKPAGGTITLDGESLIGQDPVRLAERRAVLPQATPMAFPFTVLEVVRLGLSGKTALGPEAASLPRRALAAVGLTDHAGRFFQELSGGEQQRAQLARVLVQVWEPVVEGVPRWLFLDEPVAALDIGHQLQIMRLAQEFARKGGGVVAVMHDLNLTAMIADHVCLIHSGKVLAEGRPDQVLTDTLLSRAYGCQLRVSTPPPDGSVFILPQAAA